MHALAWFSCEIEYVYYYQREPGTKCIGIFISTVCDSQILYVLLGQLEINVETY